MTLELLVRFMETAVKWTVVCICVSFWAVGMISIWMWFIGILGKQLHRLFPELREKDRNIGGTETTLKNKKGI